MWNPAFFFAGSGHVPNRGPSLTQRAPSFLSITPKAELHQLSRPGGTPPQRCNLLRLGVERLPNFMVIEAISRRPASYKRIHQLLERPCESLADDECALFAAL